MQPQSIYSVTGMNADRSWYRIAFGEQTGWVAAFVIRTGGTCTNLPVIAPPPAPIEPTSPQPEPTQPIFTMPQLDAACAAKYGGGSFGIPVNMSCFTCPDYYSHESLNSLTCVLTIYVSAIKHNPATGLLHTDCPRGQFWDIKGGYCWTCPVNYLRGPAPMDSSRACFFDHVKDTLPGLVYDPGWSSAVSVIELGPP